MNESVPGFSRPNSAASQKKARAILLKASVFPKTAPSLFISPRDVSKSASPLFVGAAPLSKNAAPLFISPREVLESDAPLFKSDGTFFAKTAIFPSKPLVSALFHHENRLLGLQRPGNAFRQAETGEPKLGARKIFALESCFPEAWAISAGFPNLTIIGENEAVQGGRADINASQPF